MAKPLNGLLFVKLRAQINMAPLGLGLGGLNLINNIPPVPTFVFHPADVALTSFNAGGALISVGARFSVDVQSKIVGVRWSDAFPGANNPVFTWTFSLWRTSDQAKLLTTTFAPITAPAIFTIMFPTSFTITDTTDSYAVTYCHTGNPANPVQSYGQAISYPTAPVVETHFTWLSFDTHQTIGAGTEGYPDSDSFTGQRAMLEPIFTSL